VVAPDARRLVVAAALRLHVARRLGPAPLPADLDAGGLEAVADRLRPDAVAGDDTLRRAYGLTFEPGYPGAGPGVEQVRGGRRRLVLECAAWRGGEPAAVVVTTLVPGRAPQVSALPPVTAAQG
jgi:hypothetical protein